MRFAVLLTLLLLAPAAFAKPVLLRLARRGDEAAVPAKGDRLALPAEPPRPPRPASALEWCGTDEDIFTLGSLTISPDPPEKGTNLTVKVEGYLKETIVQGAYADVVVKIGVVKLLDTRLDLCDQGKELVGEDCPVQPGQRALEKTVAIPEQAPKGKYKVAAVLKNADDKQIACVNAAWDWEE
ncbi:ML domain-containing protein [Hyaloraphidium curvatum]|nr:ML domain-containing protein [Hyaloraphidium curvatum]